jgi:phosphatidylserine/phosphatidylglycerophosphate/cardiolipin synthase-like enzyme
MTKLLGLILVLCVAVPAEAGFFDAARGFKDFTPQDAREESRTGSELVPASSAIESGYSPKEGAEDLVLKIINSARPSQSIRLAAYSFTLTSVVKALLAAKKRGVDVALVVDHKNNVLEDKSGRARAALSAIANAGIPVRTVSVWPIHHDKFIVVGDSVQTGSFNYSASAANRNSENVIVVWHNKPLAESFLRHWARNWNQGAAYAQNY